MLKEVQALYERLAQADRAWHRQLSARLFWRALALLPPLILLAFLLDMALHLPPGRRLAIGLGTIALLTLIAARILWLRLRARRPPPVVARQIEANDAAYGSALINSLQLADQIETGQISGLQQQLAARAIADYHQRVEAQPFDKLLRLVGLRRWPTIAACSIGGLLLLMLAGHSIARTEILRYLQPYADHPPFSLTVVTIAEPLPGLDVVYGDALIVKAETRGHTPDELFLSFYDPATPEAVTTLPMFNKGALGFYQQIENIKTPIRLFAHTRNHHARSHLRDIGIILTPSVHEATATVAPPAYTCRQPTERPYHFSNIKALIGSDITIRLTSNRPLSGGTITITGVDGDGHHVAMSPVEPHTVAGTFTAATSSRLSFTVTDVDGYSSIELLTGSLTVTGDLPPQIAIVNPDRDSFVTEDFVLDLRIDASDDYGVAQLRVHRALNKRYSPPLTFTYDSCRRSVSEVIPLDMAALGVEPGDAISIYAEAIDTRPGEPGIASTRLLSLVVVSVHEYNAFLRQRVEIATLADKYGDLVRQLDELIAEQEQLNQEVAALRDQLANGALDDRQTLQDALAERLARQQELNHKLVTLAEQMEAFSRDTPLYDIEIAFQQRLTEHARAIRESTAANQQQLEAFSQAMDSDSPNPPAMLEALQGDGVRQQQALQGHREAIDSEIVQTATELGKLNKLIRDFNQFRMCYQEQTAIAEQTRVYDVERDLSQADILALRRQARREKAIADMLHRIETNLRIHADDAQATFPKAAQGARHLADAIVDGRFHQLATTASNTMLLPDGPAGYRQAEHLRREMEKLFQESDSSLSNCESGLDAYLRLLMGMQPGNTFGQMASGMSAGDGYGFGFGIGTASGSGDAPSSFGTRAPSLGVLGNEKLPGNAMADGEAGERGNGLGQGTPAGAHQPRANLENANPVDDPSRSLQSTDAVDVAPTAIEYETLIERYFQHIIETEVSP